MSHRNFAVFLAALGLASVACSTQSPLAPGTAGDEVPRLSVMPAILVGRVPTRPPHRKLRAL